ncbi:MAG: TonB family protein [Terracidiphilus sp.]
MAHQAKLEETVPTTLPDDFDEWDGGAAAPPSTLPDDFDEFDDAPAAPARSAAPQAVVAPPVVNKVAEMPVHRAPVAPPVHTMPSPVHTPPPAAKRTQELPAMRPPAAAPQPSGAAPVVNRAAEAAAAQAQPARTAATQAQSARAATTQAQPARAAAAQAQPARAAASQAQPAKYATTEELSNLVRAYHATQDTETDDEQQRKKKMMMIWIGAGVLVLVIAAAAVFLMMRKPAEQKKPLVVVQQPQVTYASDPTPFQEKPTPSTPAQSTTGTTPTPTAPTTPQTVSVKADMMNSQLNAPSRMKDLKSNEKDSAPAPASFGTGMMDALNGTAGSPVGSVFGKQSGPKVKIESPRIVTISSGVAQGMLLQKSSPVYPPIAKTARVSGTVVLQATISKYGQIENLRVLSGPPMLQKAAVDAVRNWKYKPYLLDSQPVEVDTTVSVVFSLGG